MRQTALFCLAVSTIACQPSGSDAAGNNARATKTNAQTAGDTGAAVTRDSGASAADVTTATDCGEPAVVTFDTTDGVKLTADFQPANNAGRGAVVLFHMIPPNWDRTSYPQRVRDALQALNLNVLNVDRRGAGDSEGTARDAYEGPGGALDVEAAVSFLTDPARSCAVDMSKLMLVGASNGTTAVMDYTVGRANLQLPDPAAIAWLSPGTYTENQHQLGPQRTRLEPLPLLMIHPDNEPWAAQFVDDAVPAWKIVEIPNGKHGTQNFDDGELEAIQLPELINWATAHVAQ